MLKKILVVTGLFVFAIILSSETAFSQGFRDGRSGKTPEERATARVERMKTNLNLTESQSNQIHQLLVSHFNEVKAARELRREQGIESRKQHREEMKSKRDVVHSQIKNVLTSEQIQKWESLKSERKERWQDRGNKRNRNRNR